MAFLVALPVYGHVLEGGFRVFILVVSGMYRGFYTLIAVLEQFLGGKTNEKIASTDASKVNKCFMTMIVNNATHITPGKQKYCVTVRRYQ